MKIGILTTGRLPEDLAADVGQYPEMFQRLFDGHGFDYRTWFVVDGDFPDSPEDADGWVVTGSRHGVYEDLPWIPRLEAFIRDVAKAGRPMVGICFGHQVMAQALGGRVEKFGGGWAVGRRPYHWGGRTIHLNAWHQDQVIEPPAGAEVLATNDFCDYAVLRYSPSMMSVQPHPEFNDDVIEGLIEARGKAIPAPLLDAARAGIGVPVDAGLVAAELAAVLKGGALKGGALKGGALKGEALKGEALKGEALKGEALKGGARHG